MEIEDAPALSISAVARETGLSKDVLRKWETRYGFPVPLRDHQGERAYPPEQVHRLRLIKRLMDAGMRPARIVGENDEALRALALTRQSKPTVTGDRSREVANTTLEMLRSEGPSGLRRRLYRELLRQGIDTFVLDTLTQLNHDVGEAWARGELGIHDEHVYSEAVQWLLRNAIANFTDACATPRILLTTLPEEQHGLGILMVATLLSMRGAYCISLGTQTPLQEIALAARAHAVDVVALSFSVIYPPRRILPALVELHQRLDDHVEIWAGGGGTARVNGPPAYTRLLPEMQQTLQALADWRQAHPGTAG